MKIKILLFVIITLLFINCKKKKSTPGANEVFMSNNMFDPATITVIKGSTVTWTNKESVTHDVTSDTGLFDSGDMGKDKTFAFKFDSTGTYGVHCRHHPGMNGTVVVN